jgi:hypothetical protein
MSNSLTVAIIKAPFVAIGKGLNYIVAHKYLLAIVVVGVIFLIARAQFGDKTSPETTQATIEQQSMPPKQIAPRIIQTESRYYPCATYQDNGDSLTLTDFYTYNAGKWQHRTTELQIKKSHIVNIYTR